MINCDKIKHTLKANSTILQNLASLSLFQAANYLIPIIVLPFIVRALGVDVFGKVSYAQNVVQYFTIIITFGFEYSATKEIAIHKEDKEELCKIFWSVIASKTILLSLSFLCLLTLSSFWGKIQEDLPLYLCLFGINIGFTFFPTWFFQGMEEMKGMGLINFLIKVFGMGLSVFFISAPDDYLIYAIMPSLSYAIFGLGAFFYIIKKHRLSGSTPTRQDFIKQWKLSFPIFLTSFLAAFYSIANTTILGLYADDYEVGIYSGAYRITQCILMVTSMPINLAIFPSIGRKMAKSKEEGFKYFKKVSKYIVVAALLCSILTFAFSPILVKILLGEEFLPTIPLLRYMSCLPLLVITASLCTVHGLYGLGYQKYAPIMGFTVAVSCIVINYLLIPVWGKYGAVTAWIIAELLEIMISGSIVLIKSKKYYKN